MLSWRGRRGVVTREPVRVTVPIRDVAGILMLAFARNHAERCVKFLLESPSIVQVASARATTGKPPDARGLAVE
jgi:hypothetical protein